MGLLHRHRSTSLFMVGAILTGFAAVIGLFCVSGLQLQALRAKKTQALAIVSSWETLQRTTASLLIADDLPRAIRLWDQTINQFDMELGAFIGAPIIQRLMRRDETFAARIRETGNLWRVIKPRIEYARPRLAACLAQEQPGSGFRRSLLHELLYQVQQRSASSDYMVLFDLTYDIEYMVSSLNDYFVSTLSSTVETISARIDTESQTIRAVALGISALIVAATLIFIFISQRTLQRSESQLRFLSAQMLRAEETERKRIAGELHDGVGQSLTAIKFGIENALNSLAGHDARTAARGLENLVRMVQDTVHETRRLSVSLRPAIIDQLGIIATISWYCREYTQIYSGITVSQQIDLTEEQVPDRLKIVIFRLMQETMTNAAKHSGADTVAVRLYRQGSSLALQISDNGRGFDTAAQTPGANLSGGFGLISMQERTALSGGIFRIRSRRGQGTLVHAHWQVAG